MTRPLLLVLIAAAVSTAGVGCSGSSPSRSGSTLVVYREPSQGWTVRLPAEWVAVASGPAFVRGNPLSDPTRLLFRAYRGRTAASAARALMRSEGIVARPEPAAVASGRLTWHRYRGSVENEPSLAAELAVARRGTSSYAALLVARRTRLATLVDTVLLPALDRFAPAPVQPPRSVLATAAAAPTYWPTDGWRTASPASEGMDAKQLEAMVQEIRSAKLPIDSVTVVRHGSVVLDREFGRFAAGTLGEPYASGRLHELQSATKSVTSALVGIALREHAATASLDTKLVDLAAAVEYTPAHDDARKRAITLRDLLTMQSGLAWHESGYAFMAGLYGQLAAIVPGKDLVVVVTAHVPAEHDGVEVGRWLLERYILPAAS